MVSSFQYGSNRDDPSDYLTLSAIDLSKLPQLSQYITSLASTLTSRLKSGGMNDISRTVRSMYVFGSYDDAGSDMVDLNEFLTMCATYDPDTAAKAKALLSEAIVCSYANAYVPKATGLSIMVPMENASYLSRYLKDYASDALSGYTGFVSAFGSAVNSGSYTFSASAQSGPATSSGWGAVGNGGTTADYGTGYGYNTSGLVIAGSAGQTSASAATSVPAPAGLVIAGQQATATPVIAAQATGTPAAAAAATPAPARPVW